MFRSLCILIAFLIAAKEVVAFGSAFSKSKFDAFENLEYACAECWLCESEDSTERDYEDLDTQSDSLIPTTNAKANLRLLASIEFSSRFSISAGPDNAGELFISYHSLRL